MKTYFVWLGEKKRFLKIMIVLIELRKYLIVVRLKPLWVFFMHNVWPWTSFNYVSSRETFSSFLLWKTENCCELPVRENSPFRGPEKQCLWISDVRFTARSNFLAANSINVGFAAKKVFKNLKPTIQASEIRKFREGAEMMLVSLIQKSLRKITA